MAFLSRPASRLLRRAFGDRDDLSRVVAMMALFFLVVCSVGILRPIKNALALDGLAESEFYKVYFVSAAVMLFVPPYNRLADRFAWRWLIPCVALFFASNLVLLRIFYEEGSATFGMFFYGWYDLFAAALVTQFFMATQLFFNARQSKSAYPVVIAGGALGATLGGAITGIFAEIVGTPNLMLVAAGLIAVFAVGLPLLWPEEELAGRPRAAPQATSELARIARNPQLRLIAASVLVMVLAKQLVDYQFNTLSEQVFQTRDAVSAFQGKFNAATQWLPIVAVVGLGPLLRRWGVGTAVLLLPVAILLSSVGLALTLSLWAAVAAKTADTTLRYSAERAAREILYVPVPEAIRFRAKAYVDIAIEKGLGKAASGLLIMGLLAVLDFRWIPIATIVLALAWVVMAVAVHREYVRALAQSIQGRFASLRGIYAGIGDASTLPVVRRALGGADPMHAAFALDLVEDAATADLLPLSADLHGLLRHPSPQIRARTLAVLARHAALVRVGDAHACLADEAREVREAAVRLLYRAEPEPRGQVIRELLESDDAGVRTAVLSCIARGEVARKHLDPIGAEFLAGRRAAAAAGGAEARLEYVLAAGAIHDPDRESERLLLPYLNDADPRVASAALRSAGLLGRRVFYPRLVEALRAPATREAARDALVLQGSAAVPVLTATLLDPVGDPVVRRTVPSVLARIPAQATVDALLASFLAPETDQLLDFRTLKALNKLRARHPELVFDAALVGEAVEREVAAARRYEAARDLIAGVERPGPPTALLGRALEEAWRERREGVFRCLGLVRPQQAVHRCYLAVAGGAPAVRANALEWLENTIGHTEFVRIADVLPEERPARSVRPAELGCTLQELARDGDSWIAECARRAMLETTAATHDNHEGTKMELDLIEKVFLLQRVDLLHDAQSAHVALLASIAEEVEVEPGAVLLVQGEPPDALYTVVHGAVELRGIGEHWLIAEDGAAFGTWALIDESASVVGAVTTAPTRLLRISRADFYDLLADHPELALGLLQGLARRVRALVA